MIRQISIAAVAALFVSLAPLAAPAAGVVSVEQSFPMTCDLSGTTNANEFTFISGGISKIAFKTSKGAAAVGLNPGECAFEDRAVRSTEPQTLCVSGVTIDSISFKGMNIAGGGFNSTPAGKLAQFLVFGLGTKIWNFTVSNTGTCFVINSFGV